jgi:hypothetical protein
VPHFARLRDDRFEEVSLNAIVYLNDTLKLSLLLISPKMNRSNSNIKVFPSFPETGFFSGEEFSCILTFRNVAEPEPSLSTTSLTPPEDVENGSRILNSKYAGVEWMSESGRSASEGLPLSPAVRRPSAPGRSLSTASQGGVEKPTFSPLQGGHGRSQSVILPPTPGDHSNVGNKESFAEKKHEGTLSL